MFLKTSTRSQYAIDPDVHTATLLALFFCFVAIIIPRSGFTVDLNCWSQWASFIQQHGIRHVYDLSFEPPYRHSPGAPKDEQVMYLYGPVYMYLLHLFSKWQPTPELIRANIHLFKVFILVFDVVGIWLALRFMPKKEQRPFYALFFIFNIGLLYDTVGWGQNDATITCLTFAAVYCALRNRLTLSGICLLVALLIKPQPVVFLPALGLLLLPLIVRNKPLKTLGSLLLVVLTGVILLLPFIQAGTLGDYINTLRTLTSYNPVVSLLAASGWQLLLSGDLHLLSDQTITYGLSYRQWGLLTFAIGYAVILLPLIWQTYQLIKHPSARFDAPSILLVCGLIPIVFYFFNTQMHERYAFPSMLFLGAYWLATGDFIPYLLSSFANFWVLEKSLWILGWHRLYDRITLPLLAILILLVLIWGVVRLYRRWFSLMRTQPTEQVVANSLLVQ